MQCIEFKSELRDPQAAREQCARLGGRHLGILRYTDLYYNLRDGRLKRTATDGAPAVWFFYHRQDRARPRLCTFTVLDDAQARFRWGVSDLRTWLTLYKHRELWMLDQIRVNIDYFHGLGWFIEFESLIGHRHPFQLAWNSISKLLNTFAPILGEAIAVSYADLWDQHVELISSSRREVG